MQIKHKSFSPEKDGMLTQNDQGGPNEEMIFSALRAIHEGHGTFRHL
jgi:hypothetical protein